MNLFLFENFSYIFPKNEINQIKLFLKQTGSPFVVGPSNGIFLCAILYYMSNIFVVMKSNRIVLWLYIGVPSSSFLLSNFLLASSTILCHLYIKVFSNLHLLKSNSLNFFFSLSLSPQILNIVIQKFLLNL